MGSIFLHPSSELGNTLLMISLPLLQETMPKVLPFPVLDWEFLVRS